jgi:signal transduction histidine kinase
MRPRLGALGLRGRIVGAVVVTTVATLAVAAVALLGPLEQSLRAAERKTLQQQLNRATLDSFKFLSIPTAAGPTAVLAVLPVSHKAQIALGQHQRTLGSRLGATVNVLGYPDESGQGVLQPNAGREAALPSDSFDDATMAFQTHRPQYTFGSIDGDEYAKAALPFRHDGVWYVLAVRKPIEEVSAAVHAVRKAFVYAAVAGLLLTVLIGIPLAATLVRRLRQLRQAAVQLALGEPVALPVDRARDEVGDLARTFETMQRRLRQQEEARRAFVATASHELRTPLTSLDGMLELLDDDLRDPNADLQDARLLLERARVQSRRLGRLAADLLDLSRIDAAVALRSEPVELGELSRAVLAEFELGTSERGILSELDDADGPAWALADPGSVARIIRILLDNAVRVTPPGFEIRVDVKSGDTVELSVRDEGPGVPPEERKLIFERFQRGRDTGGGAGFGLGLAIGRELAQRMGGDLTLDETYERGAKFTLRLPAAKAPDQDPIAIA